MFLFVFLIICLFACTKFHSANHHCFFSFSSLCIQWQFFSRRLPGYLDSKSMVSSAWLWIRAYSRGVAPGSRRRSIWRDREAGNRRRKIYRPRHCHRRSVRPTLRPPLCPLNVGLLKEHKSSKTFSVRRVNSAWPCHRSGLCPSAPDYLF